MKISLPRWLPCGALPVCCAAMLYCALPRSARSDELFATGNQNELLRGFYLPRAANARAGDALSFAADLALANTTNAEHRGDQQLFVDGESVTLRLGIDAPLAAKWRFRLSLPVLRDSGGFLDQTIASWHRFFGLPQGDRPFYPKNQLHYSYAGEGRIIDLSDSGTRVGDLAGELGWYGIDGDARTVSLWTGLEAPTGSARRLSGDGAWDGAVWLHAAQRFARWQLGAELGAVQPFGDAIFGGNAHRTSAFARAAATWEVTRVVAVRLQFDAQSARLKHNELRFVGPSLSGSLGASIRVNPRWRLEFGFSEDAAVDTAPDVVFFLGVRRTVSGH